MTTLIEKGRKFKDRFFILFVKPLDFFGMTPLVLSATALILGLVAAYALFESTKLFVILIVLSTVFDALDGVLARYQKKASRRGYWIDYSFDRAVMIAVLLAVYFTEMDASIYYLLVPIIYVASHILFSLTGHKHPVFYFKTIYFLILIFSRDFATYFALSLSSLNLLAIGGTHLWILSGKKSSRRKM